MPAEVPEDFWVSFRQEVRRVNPEAWIVGEVWGDARRWLQGEHFDGVMNYRIGWSSLCWVAGDQLRQSYRNPEYPLNPLTTQELIDIWTTTASWSNTYEDLRTLAPDSDASHSSPGHRRS